MLARARTPLQCAFMIVKRRCCLVLSQGSVPHALASSQRPGKVLGSQCCTRQVLQQVVCRIDATHLPSRMLREVIDLQLCLVVLAIGVCGGLAWKGCLQAERRRGAHESAAFVQTSRHGSLYQSIALHEIPSCRRFTLCKF